MTKRKGKRELLKSLALTCIMTMIGLTMLLYTGALFLEAKVMAQESRERTELFDPWEDTSLENSYKTMWLQAVSDAFASDFKDEYFFNFVYDHNYELRIVRMTQEQFDELKTLNDYMYDDSDIEEPETVQVRGTAVLIEEDIKEYALELLDYMFGEGIITSDNFESYVGRCYLDLSRAPGGGADYEYIRELFFGVAAWLVIGVSSLIRVLVRLMNEEQTQDTTEDKAERERQRFREEQAVRYKQFEPEPDSNRLFGIIGAVLGALAGTGVWIMVGFLGFIAGIAGYLIMQLTMGGYRKFSGKMDRTGVIICIVIGILTIPAAGLAESFLELSKVYMEFDMSFSTVEYVAANFMDLMSKYEVWPSYIKNLIFGYVLSILSCRSLIAAELEKSRKPH